MPLAHQLTQPGMEDGHQSGALRMAAGRHKEKTEGDGLSAGGATQCTLVPFCTNEAEVSGPPCTGTFRSGYASPALADELEDTTATLPL